MTPEHVAQMQKEMADRMAEAEQTRQVVEYRMFYADYKTFDGVKLPTRIQRMIDGKPSKSSPSRSSNSTARSTRRRSRSRSPRSRSRAQRMLPRRARASAC